MTSAATPATSLAAEEVEGPVEMPGEDPLSGSVQKKNRVLSVPHNPQTASPGSDHVQGTRVEFLDAAAALRAHVVVHPAGRAAFGPFASVWR